MNDTCQLHNGLAHKVPFGTVDLFTTSLRKQHVLLLTRGGHFHTKKEPGKIYKRNVIVSCLEELVA